MALNKRFLSLGGVSGDPATVHYLVVGGGGGTYTANGGGGGGAGGLRTSYGSTSGGGGSAESQLTFNPGKTYTITVGAAGTTSGSNTDGGDSSITGSDITDIISDGGGKGGTNSSSVNGSDGGSGGGAGAPNVGYSSSDTNQGGNGTTNQGFDGGFVVKPSGGFTPPYGGAGGGGAGGDGVDKPYDDTRLTTYSGTDGGDSLANSITASSVYYAGGAPGRRNASQNNYNGSAFVASQNGSFDSNFTPAVNSGGGEYSGVVILRIPTAVYTGVVTGSPTVTTSGSDTILKFTGSGTYKQ